MKINRILFLIAASLLLFVGVVCCVFSAVFRLDDPVFFQNYGQYFVSKEQLSNGVRVYLTDIKYVTNVDDQRYVSGVVLVNDKLQLTLSNQENMQPSISFGNQSNQDQGVVCGCYRIRTARLYLSNNYIHDFDLNGMHFQKAIVYFKTGNKGNGMTVNIGDIELNFYDAYQNTVIKHQGSLPITDGSRAEVCTLDGDVTLIKLDCPMLDANKDLVDLKFNDLPYEKIVGEKLTAGALLRYTIHFPQPKDLLRRYNTYDFIPKLVYENAAGAMGYYEIPNVNYHYQYFSQEYPFWDLVKYLHLRGAL